METTKELIEWADHWFTFCGNMTSGFNDDDEKKVEILRDRLLAADKMVKALEKIAEAEHPTGDPNKFATASDMRDYAVASLTTYREAQTKG